MEYKSTKNQYLGTRMVALGAPVIIFLLFITDARIEALTCFGIVSMVALVTAYFCDIRCARNNLVDNLKKKYHAVPVKRVKDPAETKRTRLDVLCNGEIHDMLMEQDPQTFEPYLVPNALDGAWLDEYGTLKKLKDERTIQQARQTYPEKRGRGRIAGPGRVR